MTTDEFSAGDEPERTTKKKRKRITAEILTALLKKHGGRVTQEVVSESGYSAHSALDLARLDKQKRFGVSNGGKGGGEIWLAPQPKTTGELVIYERGVRSIPKGDCRRGRFSIIVSLVEQPLRGEDLRMRAKVLFRPAQKDGAPKEIVFAEREGNWGTSFEDFLGAVGAEIDRLKEATGCDPLA